MTIEQPRQPKGVPTGGQFAGTARSESVVELAPAGSPADTVSDVDEVIRAAQDDIEAVVRQLAVVDNRIGTLRYEERAARQALDGWNTRHWGQHEAPAPPATLTAEADRVAEALDAATAERTTVRGKLDQARANAAALTSHYPWAGTGTPVIRFVGGLERPVDVAPSGRFAFHDFPDTDPRHGSVGIAMAAGDQWGPYESVTPERLARLTQADGTASFAAQDYVDYRIQMTADDVQALKAYAARRHEIGAAA